MYHTLLLEHHGSVALITLNRPDQLNAYTVRMGEELVQVFDSIKHNPDVRAVVLTGAGRAFCAGVDLKVLSKGSSTEEDRDLPPLGKERFVQNFAEDLYQFPKPVIAAINGPAVGVGVTMCLPCDIRLAATDATLSMPFARLGIVPGLGSSYLLPRLVGPGNARLLMFTGMRVTAEEALAMRLVEQIHAPGTLINAAMGLAKTMAENPSGILPLIKDALNAGLASSSIQSSMAYEHACNARR